MATVKLLGDDELSPEAKSIFDDIRTKRKTDYVNNFWRALAHDPKALKRTWESLQEVMGPGAPRSEDEGAYLHRCLGSAWLQLLHSLAHGRSASEGYDGTGICRAYRHRRDGGGDQQARDGARRAGR